jgi:hypothetical protein
LGKTFIFCQFFLLLFLFSCGKDSEKSQVNFDNIRVIESAMKLNFPNVQMKHNWSPKYDASISKYLLERSELSTILTTEIKSSDLKLLRCLNYNQSNTEEKIKFWTLYLASIAYAESNLNPNTTFREKDGTLSSGLLQIDLASANRHSAAYTGYIFSQKDLFNQDLNLMAGLYILKNQLAGGIFSERPDIKSRLFTDNSYYWSVLTLKREMIIKTFTKNALANLPFCFIGT